MSFDPRVDFATGALPVGVAISDVNGDGKPDLVTVNTGANTVSIFIGTGTGSFGPKTDGSVGAVPHGLALADLNGDSRLDIVVANESPARSASIGREKGLVKPLGAVIASLVP